MRLPELPRRPWGLILCLVLWLPLSLVAHRWSRSGLDLFQTLALPAPRSDSFGHRRRFVAVTSFSTSGASNWTREAGSGEQEAGNWKLLTETWFN